MDGLDAMLDAIIEPPAEPATGASEPVAEAQTTPTPEAPVVEAPAQPATPPEGYVPMAALKAEREKRQEYERKLAEAAQAAQPKPEFWEDPEGHIEKLRGEFKEGLARERVRNSEAFESQKHEDYSEARDHFMALASENPVLATRMFQAENPAAYAYEVGKKALLLDKMAVDPVGYEAKLRAELEAKYQRTVDARVAAELKKRDTIPTSLGGLPGGGGTREPAWNGPPSLSEIVPKT